MEKLDLSGCTTNKEVSRLIQERVREVSLGDMLSSLSEKFVYQEETITKLYTSMATGNNILLYGLGGFGKSVVVKSFCEELGIPLICKVGYKDMNPEELLGIPNMKKLLEDSKYETAFENSIFCIPGVLLLEEFGDVAESTVAALKDILTEKGFREGDVRKESLIGSIVITSNKTPDELVTSDTTAALYKERFPIRHNTVWHSFNKENYSKYFSCVYKEIYTRKKAECDLIAKLCSDTTSVVSPRIAGVAVSIMDTLGLDHITSISDINTDKIKDYKDKLELDRKLNKEKDSLDIARDFIHNIKFNDTDDSYMECQRKIIKGYSMLDDITVSEESWTDKMQVTKYLDVISSNCEDYLKSKDNG